MYLSAIYGDFICTDPRCGCRREIIRYVSEPHGEQVLEMCHCGSHFDNAVECAYCGKVIAESKAEREDGEYVCRECLDEEANAARDEKIYNEEEYELDYPNINGRYEARRMA